MVATGQYTVSAFAALGCQVEQSFIFRVAGRGLLVPQFALSTSAALSNALRMQIVRIHAQNLALLAKAFLEGTRLVLVYAKGQPVKI